MVIGEVIGSIEEKQLSEGVQIEWKIPDFSSIVQTKNYCSPTFSFEGDSWYLGFWHLCFSDYPDIVLLSPNLNNDKTRKYSVEYNFGFKKKKLVEKVEEIGSGIIEGEKLCKFPKDHFKLSEIGQRKSELLLSDTLTIVCSLKRKGITEHSIYPTALSRSQPQHKVLIKLDVLSENLRSIFANKETCDTTLNVKGKEYKAHKTILMSRSPVFAAMFLHDTAEKQTGSINIPDCDPESFEEFLEYLYCGKLENLSSRSALHLYETSDKYNIQELKDFCVECLIETLTVENLCDVVIMADKYDDTKLFSAAQCFFSSNFKKVLLTSGWDCLLKTHHRLVNKLLIEMSSKIKIVV